MNRYVNQIGANKFIAYAEMVGRDYIDGSSTIIFVHEVTKWCEETFGFGNDELWVGDFYGTFEFVNREDAVLFKLRWM